MLSKEAAMAGLKAIADAHVQIEEARKQAEAKKAAAARDSLAKEKRAQEEKDAANQAPPWSTAELSGVFYSELLKGNTCPI